MGANENENGTYELKSKDGKLLKQKVPGVNLKIYHKRPKMDGSTCRPQGLDTADVISPDPGLPTSVMSKDLVQTDKPDDSATTEDDITVTAVDSSEPHFGFVPTSVAWRKYHATRLKLPNPRKMKIRQKQTVLTVPKTVDRIKGDGNCFFRAMSLEITGSQSNHPQVRELTVRFLCRRGSRIQKGGGFRTFRRGGGGVRTGISGADPNCCRVLRKSTSKKNCRQP